MTRHITRITLTDESTIAEAWELTGDPCLWCGAVGHVWRILAGGEYRIDTACKQGGGPDQAPHTPASNDVFAQLVGQLEAAV